jgi:hypothetical protein
LDSSSYQAGSESARNGRHFGLRHRRTTRQKLNFPLNERPSLDV